jgi:hypothetical protein
MLNIFYNAFRLRHKILVSQMHSSPTIYKCIFTYGP